MTQPNPAGRETVAELIERLRNRNVPYGWPELADKAANMLASLTPGKAVGPDSTVLQNDLRDMLRALGLSDASRPESPHEVFRACIDEVRRLKAAGLGRDEWQPIETAPMDGTWFLAMDHELYIGPCNFNPDDGLFYCPIDHHLVAGVLPTHWRPVFLTPAQPEQAAPGKVVPLNAQIAEALGWKVWEDPRTPGRWFQENSEAAMPVLDYVDTLRAGKEVPGEVTDEMIAAGSAAIDAYYDGTKDAPFEGSVAACYRAMRALDPASGKAVPSEGEPTEADWRAFSASEAACYHWPNDTDEHKALRAAYIAGAAASASKAG